MSTRKNTEITVRVELTADGKLIFRFLPEGLHFQPKATLILFPDELENAHNVVFDADNPFCLYWRNPEEQSWEFMSCLDNNTDDVEWDDQKRAKLRIPHFSLYSLSKD